MSQIVLDIGSGNTLKSETDAIQLIDLVTDYDTGKHEVIFKTQLFEDAPPNIPLSYHVFKVARAYARRRRYKLTSSVFDRKSLLFLLSCDTEADPLPFVKIACRPDLYWLIGEVPRRIPVYVSFEADDYEDDHGDTTKMLCVPKYPALYAEYHSASAISDHTVGLSLFNDYKPKIWEKHLCLERDPKNPDSGPFALLPEDLEEIL